MVEPFESLDADVDGSQLIKDAGAGASTGGRAVRGDEASRVATGHDDKAEGRAAADSADLALQCPGHGSKGSKFGWSTRQTLKRSRAAAESCWKKVVHEEALSKLLEVTAKRGKAANRLRPFQARRHSKPTSV